MGFDGSPSNGAGGSGIVIVKAPSSATLAVAPGTTQLEHIQTEVN